MTTRVVNESPPQFRTNLPCEMKLSKDENGLPRVSILGYTGKEVELWDYGVDAPVVYNVAGIKLGKDKIPYLLNHSSYHPLGHVEKTNIGNGQVMVEAVHSYPSQESKDVAQAIENGLPYQASMGLDIIVNSVTYHNDGNVMVNGRTFAGPIYVVNESLLTEMSATLFGRDDDTSITKLSKDTLKMIKNNAPIGSPPAAKEAPVTPQEPTTPVAPVSNSQPAPVAPVVPVAPVAPVANTNPATDPTLTKVLNWMVAYKDHPELIKNGVEGAWDDDRMKREVELKKLHNSYPQVPGAFIPSTKVDNAYVARLAYSIGVSPKTIEAKLGKPAADYAISQPLMGFTEGLMYCANANGGAFNGHSDKHQLAKFVKRLHMNNSFSTIDYPNLMHQVTMWKMEDAWLMDTPYAPTVCKVESNKDFKKTGHIKPQGGKMWEGLNQEGKITHGSFGKESKYETELATIAQIVTFKREDIENDDIGWIDETLKLMLEGAMMYPDWQLVQLIYGGVAAGVQTNTGTNRSVFDLPLTPENLEIVHNAVKRRVVDKEGPQKPNARHAKKHKLVITSDLEKTAWEIIMQKRFVQGPDGEFIGEDNYWANKFEIEIFDQLDNTSYHPNANARAWGLLPINTEIAPYAITYLRGQSRPTTELVDLPADELGFGVRGYWDVNLNYRPVHNNLLQSTAWSFPADES